MRVITKTLLTSFVLAGLAPAAFADEPVEPSTTSDDDTGKTAPPTNPTELPPPQSDTDPAPPVASPDMTLPPGGVVKQAGVGGEIGYGRAGVLEIGGSAGLMIAPDFRNVNIAPMVGWFVADNLELSAILGVSNVKAGENSATVWSALVEPSYHLPFNRTTFGFLGLGVGAAYQRELGAGLAIAPRIGANFMIGRSGVLTPSLAYEYTTHSSETTTTGDMQNVTLMSVSSAMRFNVGYSAMW